ncbi:MAG: phosphotransferase [Desulfobulbaceae bacterium]|nr:phosphotransferase [Desulfobulbaceae bacterium]HIJ79427.1 phosphotransferase [Deltaproteobacteria bacterium]
MSISNCQDMISRLLAANGKLSAEVCSLAQKAGDGSDRLFFRCTTQDASYLAVLPNPENPRAYAEAGAADAIGRHLHSCGVPVPVIHGYDPKSGLIIFEDLGDVLLHKVVQEHGAESDLAMGYYQQALAALVKLQVAGRKGFDSAWCWDTPRYDRQLMLSRESGYFKEALCVDYLGMEDLPVGLDREFLLLAGRASEEPDDFVLHRDFQSRNIMVHEKKARLIDFQGARFGPLGYDPASLLIDPYVSLGGEQQEQLFAYYMSELAKQISFDQARFIEGYFYLALQRNLQILGAFSFLCKSRGKEFFRQFIQPAALVLNEHLRKPQGRDFPNLRNVVVDVNERLQKQAG